ncbi:hypothetical protein JCM33374_g4192 [Metschnikowia sp. JCM 33374]|nr:hypothetical protein JCM33374_g4192 [Metschnikowia sp. JCM 33374]
MIEDNQTFTVEDICSLGKISKILCKFFSCQPHVAFNHDVSAVKKARKLYGHNTYHVSELLQNQTKSLSETVLQHVSEARARGSNAMVNARLATIYRSLNFERLAIFKDKEQVLLVMELLMRIGTQTSSTKDWAKVKFSCLPRHSRDAVQLYLEATIEQINADDMPLAKIEEMKRHVNVQLAQQSMNMEEELHKYRAKLSEMLRANKKLQKITDTTMSDALKEELILMSWDLQLMEHVVMQYLWETYGHAKPQE